MLLLAGAWPFETVLAQEAGSAAHALDAATGRVTQEIRFHAPDAGEVRLVWGVDGWRTVAEERRPAGTVIVADVMHTLMARDGATFTAVVDVAEGSMLDYGFLITARRDGAPVRVWETTENDDFHSPAQHGRAIEVHSKRRLIAPLVRHEIRYLMPEAGEVVLVWGLDGWTALPEGERPAETTLEAGIMHTPMQRIGERFRLVLDVPDGAMIDFGFLITRKRTGAPVREWEGNRGLDFHQVAEAGGLTEVESERTLLGARDTTKPLDSAPRLLLVLTAALLALMGLARLLRSGERRRLSPWQILLSTAACLSVLLIYVRAHVLGIDWSSARAFHDHLLLLSSGSQQDLVHVAVLGAAFSAPLLVARGRPGVQYTLCAVFGLVALASLATAALNLHALPLIGRSFTYAWLYYSDFLRSADARNALSTNFSWVDAGNVASLCVSLPVLYLLLARAQSIIPSPARRLGAAVGAGGFLAIVLSAGSPAREHYSAHRLENPVSVFLASLLQAWRRPALFEMSLGPEFADYPELVETESPRTSTPIADAQVRNVILFVLESTAAEYLETYGGSYPVTPNLHRYSHQSAQFTRFYSHAPSTNKALLSLLASLYPWLSYKSMTAENPRVALPTLSSELKRHGYRTAFIAADDTRYQRRDEFIAGRGFDEIRDVQSLSCEREAYRALDEDWNMDVYDDACLVEAFTDWLDGDPKSRFFTMFWTGATHYPYLVFGEELDYGVASKPLHRYLNALRHIDATLGRLLGALEARGLDESTLVAVVGDHGEAFGRHGQVGHASKIYEENVRVPLVLINPQLFSGESHGQLGGLIDVAPTVLHLVGLPAPDAWQGRSLFAESRPKRVYFFSPFSSFLFGYREGDRKLIYDAISDEIEIYDLAADPYESTSRAGDFSELAERGRGQLAVWVQHQTRLFESLLDRGPDEEPR